MSDTPKTDAVWKAAKRPPLDGPEKWLDSVARTLEKKNQELIDFIETVAAGNTEDTQLIDMARSILDDHAKSVS